MSYLRPVEVDDVGEQEGAALGLRDAADELQPYQRMQLGVLVDRMIDPRQQAPRLEVREVFLQVEPRLRRLIALRFFRYVIHIPRSVS